MNYDLAMMALEGLSRAPLKVIAKGAEVEIHGSGPAFKELARLCLLLGSETANAGEEFELKSPLHVAPGSSGLHLRRI